MRYWHELRGYFKRRVRSSADVDDLVQEVCVRFLGSRHSCRPENPLAYLYGIAGHVLADHRRSSARDRGRVPEDVDCLLAADAFACGVSAYDDVWREQVLLNALSQLPIKQSLVLIAHERDGLSYRETARKFNLTVNTVEKYLTQAKAELRLKCRD